jgi:hypothetical protein
MANCIPLQLDLNTGRIRLTRKGLGSGSVPTGFFRVIGYRHDETIAATTWTIVHSAGSEDFNIDIFDTTGNYIIPDNVVIVDDDNIIVEFGAPQAGKAIFTFFKS